MYVHNREQRTQIAHPPNNFNIVGRVIEYVSFRRSVFTERLVKSQRYSNAVKADRREEAARSPSSSILDEVPSRRSFTTVHGRSSSNEKEIKKRLGQACTRSKERSLIAK